MTSPPGDLGVNRSRLRAHHWVHSSQGRHSAARHRTDLRCRLLARGWRQNTL